MTIMYKLYAIDRYAGKSDNFIKNSFIEKDIDSLVKELLTNDKGYHMRIRKGKIIFFLVIVIILMVLLMNSLFF